MILAMFKRFLGRSSTVEAGAKPSMTPEQLVEQIQQGNLRLRNQFITDYQPYIAKVTSRLCKRYIEPARDDEFSIALAAFNEAINQFNPTAGRSFLGFAETVIRRRLIDYIRKEQRYAGQMPFSAFEMEDEEDNLVNPVEIQRSIEAYEHEKDAEDRRSEILDLNRCLLEFDISFSDLVRSAPKHEDSRRALLAVGCLLARDSQMMRSLLERRLLPIKELLTQVEFSRKTLERNRKYIIAVALIHNGPYPYLRDYLQNEHPAEEKRVNS